MLRCVHHTNVSQQFENYHTATQVANDVYQNFNSKIHQLL